MVSKRVPKRTLKAVNLQTTEKMPYGIGETDLMKRVDMELTVQRHQDTEV